MKIVYTDTAKEGIEAIYQFNLQFNQNYAIHIYNRILEEIEILNKFPGLSPVEPLLENKSKEYRSLVILKGKIKVIYYYTSDTIFITYIWDCRQNPAKLRQTSR